MGCSCSKKAETPIADASKPVEGVPEAPVQQAPMTEAVVEKATSIYNQLSAAVTNATSATPEAGAEGAAPAPGIMENETVKNVKGAVESILNDVTAGFSAATGQAEKKKKKRKNKKKAKAADANGAAADDSGADASPGEDEADPQAEAEPVEGVPEISEGYYTAEGDDNATNSEAKTPHTKHHGHKKQSAHV